MVYKTVVRKPQSSRRDLTKYSEYTCIQAQIWHVSKSLWFSIGAFRKCLQVAKYFANFVMTVKESFRAYCKYVETVQLLRVLLLLHSLRTTLFVTVQEHFIAYCRCGEDAKLFRFLLSPYSLLEACNHMQNSIFRDCTRTFCSLLLVQRGCKVI
jgi:hypothetical protein